MTVHLLERSKSVSCCLNINNWLCLQGPTADFTTLHVCRMAITLTSDTRPISLHRTKKWLMGWMTGDPMTDVQWAKP